MMCDMPEEIGIDKDYPQTGDNRFSLKIKEHRVKYTRAIEPKGSLAEGIKELADMIPREAHDNVGLLLGSLLAEVEGQDDALDLIIGAPNAFKEDKEALKIRTKAAQAYYKLMEK